MDTLTEQETEDLALAAQRVRAWRVKYDARLRERVNVLDLIEADTAMEIARSANAGARYRAGCTLVHVEALVDPAQKAPEQRARRGLAPASSIREWLIKPTDEYGSALNTKALRIAKARKIVQAHTPSEIARIPTRVLRHARQNECVAKIESGCYALFLTEVALRITARQFDSFAYAVFKDHPLLTSRVENDPPMAFEYLAHKANKQYFRRACAWLVDPKETALPKGVHWAVEVAQVWLAINPE